MPRSGALPHTGFALALRAALGRGLLVPTRATLAVLGEVTAWAQTPGKALHQHSTRPPKPPLPPFLPPSFLPPTVCWLPSSQPFLPASEGH